MRDVSARFRDPLYNFFLDTNTGVNGYATQFMPFMANANSFLGTGQLQNSKDMCSVDSRYYLIPTAEVPLTSHNMPNEILSYN